MQDRFNNLPLLLRFYERCVPMRRLCTYVKVIGALSEKLCTILFGIFFIGND